MGSQQEEEPVRRWSRTVLILLMLSSWLVSASAAMAGSALIVLRPHEHHPTANVGLKGMGFGPNEQVEVDFDATTVAMATTNGGGKFSTIFRVPANAIPGDHIVTAVGAPSGLRDRAKFTVTTYWLGFHFRRPEQSLQPLRERARHIECVHPGA
jgi:hypothetical protein